MIDRFPTVRFVVRRGRLLVRAAGALPVLAAFLGIGIEGWHWFWMAAGLLAGACLAFVTRLLVELTIIIADMLLPE